MDTGIKTKDQCEKCKTRRKDGFVWCLCGNKLWETPNMKVRIGGNIITGNSHQGLH